MELCPDRSLRGYEKYCLPRGLTLEFKRPRPSISQGALCGPSPGVCVEAYRDKATDGLGSARLAVVGLLLSPVVGTRQELIVNPV
jgi:hypothetical protein